MNSSMLWGNNEISIVTIRVVAKSEGVFMTRREKLSNDIKFTCSWNSRENAKVFLEENPDISNQIEFAIRESAGLTKDSEKNIDSSDVVEVEENKTESIASK